MLYTHCKTFKEENLYMYVLGILSNHKSFTSKTVLPHRKSLENWVKCKRLPYISIAFAKSMKIFSHEGFVLYDIYIL